MSYEKKKERLTALFGTDWEKEEKRFFLLVNDEFLALRSRLFLTKIILVFSFFRRKITLEQNREDLIFSRPIRGILRLPFGERRILGIAIVLRRLKESEVLGQRHIIGAIQQLIGSAAIYKNSFITSQHSQEMAQTLYLEIEKMGGEDFSSEEFRVLKKFLSAELAKRIQTLSPSLFAPQNVEELYREILVVSSSMKTHTEKPKAIISFLSQGGEKLTFSVVLLTSSREEDLCVFSENKSLQSKISFVREKRAALGALPGGYYKEAHVFSVEVKNSWFLKQDHSIDLLRARQFVSSTLEKRVGPFFDTKGEFYLKQNEWLHDLIRKLGQKGKGHELLLERFFHSLFPASLLRHLSEETLISFAEFFLKGIQMPQQKGDSFSFFEKALCRQEKALFLKTDQEELVASLLDRVQEIDFPSFKYAYVQLEMGAYKVFCFLEIHQATGSNIPSLRERVFRFSKRAHQTLRLPLSGLPHSLDPHTGIDRCCRILQHSIYEMLTRIVPDGKVVPAVARSIEISSDQKRYIFRLRSCYWSNGEKVTAFDFEWGWKKALSPHSDCLRADLFYPIKNAILVKKGVLPLDALGVKATDERTLVVDLAHLTPYFLNLVSISLFAPLYRGYERGEGEMVNGPFTIQSWSEGHKIVLVKNPKYWDVSTVCLEKIEFICVKEHERALALFEQGKVHWAGKPLTNLPLDEISRLKQTKQLITAPISEVFWLCCNLKHFPLNSRHFRRSLASAVDREALAKNFLNGETPSRSILPENLSILDEDSLYPDGDGDFARCQMKHALEELNTSLDQLPPLVFSHSNSPVQRKLAKAIKHQWESALGITVTLEESRWKQFSANLGANNFCVGGCLWDSVYADPICNLEFFRDSTTAYNVPQWQCAKYNQWLDLADQELSLSIRREYLCQAERLLLEQMPVIPIYSEQLKYVKSNSVKGIYVSPTGQIDFKWAYIA